MSTPIERVDEEMEDEDEMKNNDAEQTPEQTDEQHDEQPEQTPVIPDYASKVVKKLSKDERAMLLDKFEQGSEDPYFKVIKMSNGAIRITKRKNPLTNNVKQAVENVNERVVNKATKHATGTRLTNEQLLMEHIIDLESRFETMRLKHKKLKRRYNELESAIYDDVNEVGVKPVETVSEPLETIAEEPVEQVEQVSEPVVEAPRTTTYERARRGKLSWRDAISYMK